MIQDKYKIRDFVVIKLLPDKGSFFWEKITKICQYNLLKIFTHHYSSSVDRVLASYVRGCEVEPLLDLTKTWK